MIAPTVEQVADRARFWLGDTEVSGGQVFKNTTPLLQQAVQSAYEDAYQDLNRRIVQLVERTAYLVLPAHQSALRPAQFGLTNFGLIHELRVRPLASGWPKDVSTASPSTSALRLNLASAHSLSSGAWVEVYNMTGLSEDANGSFSSLAVDADSLDILGNLATGTYTSGGRVAYSLDPWSDPLPPVRDLTLLPRTPQSQPDAFYHAGDYIHLPSTPTQLELSIKFGLSPSIDASSPTASLGIPNSLHYFGLRVAHFLSESKTASTRTKHDNLARKADAAWGQLINALTLQRQATSPILSPAPLIEPPSDLFD